MQLSAETAVEEGFDMLDYSYAPSGQRGRTVVDSERELWCAVIAQAFLDIGAIHAISPGPAAVPGPARSRDAHVAAHWLLYNGNDFFRICDLAGVSPEAIRQAAKLHFLRQAAV